MKPQRRILIVDDSAEDRVAFRRFLQQDPDYQNLVQEVFAGDEGVEACRRETFDVVLLDHHMPRMDGLEALRALRAMPGWSTAVVALTSTGRADVARLMLEAGATDFLFKDDVTASSLSRAITNAITREVLQRRVEKAAWRTARLQQVTAELSRARTPRQVIDVFLQRAMETLGVVAGFVALLSQDGAYLELDASPGFEEENVRNWKRIQLSASLPITDAARTGALVTTGSREELSSRYPALKELFPRYPAMAAIPLRVGENRLGAVAVFFSQPHVFDEEEQDFLLVLTRQCAQALERAQLYEEARVARDVARLQEERFRALILASSPEVWRADAFGQNVANISLQGALTGQSPEKAVGFRWMDALHPEDREAVTRRWHEAVRSERMFQAECRVRAPDGSWRVHLSHGVPVRGADGVVREWIGANYDISERKAFELGLVHQKEAEKKRADFEQKLVGIVSHDLKNPLAAILMQSAMAVRQGGLDDRTLKMMTRIQSAAERATRMIRDLLDFTQARLGDRIPVQVSELDAREVVSQVLEEVRHAFPNRQLGFEATGDTTGAWDGDRLAQVVTNLVQNAVKYSPEDTGIQVRLRSDRDEVELSVHNQGTPIPAERLPHLFEPLQRATSLDDKAGRSVGLGLYIVKHLVEAHHGSITVSSREDEGTLFTVRLPRHGPRSARQ